MALRATPIFAHHITRIIARASFRRVPINPLLNVERLEFVHREIGCVAQLGDGDIVWLRPDGTCERPFPVEPALGTETDSLCSPNAQERWKSAVLDRRGGGLLLLTTDGLPNSFADDTAFDQFVGSLRQRIHDHGFAGVADALPAWLDHYSDQGSGDDMTLVIVDVPPIDERQSSADE